MQGPRHMQKGRVVSIKNLLVFFLKKNHNFMLYFLFAFISVCFVVFFN